MVWCLISHLGQLYQFAHQQEKLDPLADSLAAHRKSISLRSVQIWNYFASVCHVSLSWARLRLWTYHLTSHVILHNESDATLKSRTIRWREAENPVKSGRLHDSLVCSNRAMETGKSHNSWHRSHVIRHVHVQALESNSVTWPATNKPVEYAEPRNVFTSIAKILETQ